MKISSSVRSSIVRSEDLPFADQPGDAVDITLVEEAERAVHHGRLVHTLELEAFRIIQ
jgi:hypothetical protein